MKQKSVGFNIGDVKENNRHFDSNLLKECGLFPVYSLILQNVWMFVVNSIVTN